MTSGDELVLDLGGSGESTSGGEGGESASSSEGEGDGDDSGEDEEYCDLSMFEAFEPMWMVEEVDAADQHISAIVLAEQSVFIAGRIGPDSGFLERKTLAGERTWFVEAPMMTGYVGADASHIYYLEASGDIVRRRALADGVRDESWGAAPPSLIRSINPRGEHLMISGADFTEHGQGLDAPKDARFTLLSKTEHNTVVADWTFGEAEPSDHAAAVSALASGGWIANVATWDQPSTRVVSLGTPVGEELDVTFAMTPDSRAVSLHERPEGLLMFGIETGVFSGHSWVLAADEDGTELWRKSLTPCGPDIGAVIYDEAVIADDGVWILFHVATGYDINPMNQPLLARLSFDGEIEASWRFEPPHAGAYKWNVIDFVGDGDTMVVSMFSRDYDAPNRYWVARLR